MPASYQPLLTPPSYDYDDHRPPALDTTVVSVQPQTQASLLSTPVNSDPGALYPCDHPALMAQYLPNYPPLQPERVMGLQPATNREEMIYPNVSPIVKYEANPDSPHDTSGPGIQPPPYVPTQTGAVPPPYSISEPSPYDGHGMVVNLPSRFHPIQCFEVGPGTENAGAQDLDFFPAHRTTPVKRGPFKDQDSREKTALTRKMGSCIRCRMQRIRVSAYPSL